MKIVIQVIGLQEIGQTVQGMNVCYWLATCTFPALSNPTSLFSSPKQSARFFRDVFWSPVDPSGLSIRYVSSWPSASNNFFCLSVECNISVNKIIREIIERYLREIKVNDAKISPRLLNYVLHVIACNGTIPSPQIFQLHDCTYAAFIGIVPNILLQHIQ